MTDGARATIASLFVPFAVAALFATPAAAQSSGGRVQSSSDPGRSPVIWSAIGGGIGFGAGLLVGLTAFDDAVYAERKILTASLLSAAGGALAGGLLSRRAGQPSAGAPRDPLWNGMLVGAAGGAALGLWYVPAANCKTDINPECPRILRLAVGIPAIAGGAAIGALIDRSTGSRPAPAPRPQRSFTVLTPLIGPNVIGFRFHRSF